MAPARVQSEVGSDESSSSSSSPTFTTPPSPRHAEPVAICGLACRLPGGSSSPAEFWDLISKGGSGQCGVPQSRFNIDGFYHPNGMDRPGSVVTKGGYFLDDDIRSFDNGFFGINNLEATYMDPQQRKLLEVVFECLESAGVSLDDASGSNTGAYVGNFTFDYMVMQTKESEYMNRYSATGLGTTILGNRISHVFNLQGPSLVIDTACSSSLYCLHVACTALANYECDAAIVAGANLIQSAEQHIATMKAGVLSPTSTCHTFDASADGYGRGEGIGALYVKRLSDAIRDGDPIRSVIRGSAINANGKTAGISLPSADGQEAVIRKAMARGDIEPDDITYIECHGTGTKVGDAIEVEALSRVFRRPNDRPLIIGSVKSNVGHSEAASGIAGVLKATLALETGMIPPTHGLKNINQKLRIEERNISIPTTLMAWPNKSPRVRRIGVNSFGYGGANAHVIVEEAPSTIIPAIREETRQSLVSQSAVVLPISAASPASLEARFADLSNFDFNDASVLDLAYTLGSRRTQFPVRGFLVAPRDQKIASSFASKPFIMGDAPANTTSNTPFAFVFTGQGSQWAGMCSQLLDMAVFRNAILEMDSVLQSLPNRPEWTLREILLDSTDSHNINLPEISQPICTAIQVAVLQLLASWGVFPSMTVGHSSGEIAAAFAAGHISAAESIVIAYYRGYCVAKNKQDGGMMAVGLSESTAAQEIANLGLTGQLTVACVNSPEGVTVSGDAAPLHTLHSTLENRKIFARKLKTGGQAYHSHHMLACGDEYQSLLERVLPTLDPSIRFQNDKATMMSSVTGNIKTSGYGPRYWRQNLESQVRFSYAIQHIQKRGSHFFVEIGPHSSLKLPIKQALEEAGVTGSLFKYAAPIQRNTNAMESALSFIGTLWLNGYAVEWSKVNGLQTSLKSSKGLWQVVKDLPRYPFDHGNTALWSESRASIEYRQRKYPRHELLGSLVPGGSGRDFIFRNVLKVDDVPWIKYHRLEDAVVFAGAGYLCMAMEAVMQATDMDRVAKPSFSFSNVNIMNALVLSTEPSAQVEIFTSLHKSDISNAATSSIWWDFTISTYHSAVAVIHAKGLIAISATRAPLESKYEAPLGVLESTAKRTWYGKFIKSGLNYGSDFQPIEQFQTPRMKTSSLHSGATCALLTASGDPVSVYPIHPITIDAAIQLCIVATANGVPKDLRAQVPTKISSMTLNTAAPGLSGEKCQINALARKSGFGSADAGAEIISSDGEIIAQFDSLRLAVYQAGGHAADDDERHPVLRVLWKPDVYGLGLLEQDKLLGYAQKFADEANSPVKDDGLLKLGAMLDLLVHKNPRSRILELNNDSHEFTMAVLEMLSYQQDFKKLVSYSTASFTENGSLSGGAVDLETGERTANPTALDNGSFDLVLIPSLGVWTGDQLRNVTDLLAEHAIVVGLDPNASSDAISKSGLPHVSFPVSDGRAAVFVAQKAQSSRNIALEKHKFVIVEREKTRLGSALADLLRPIQGHWVARVRLSDLQPESISSGDTVFNLCEVKTPLLSTATDEEMRGVKFMTDNAKTLIWVTSGNTLHADQPEFALAAGMSRAVTLEQPSLKFYTYDIDEPERDVDVTAEHLVSTLHQQSGTDDREFVQQNGVVHVSRFVPDDGLNEKFRAKQGLKTMPMPLEGAGLVRLHIDHAGQFDTIFFKQKQETIAIGPNEVRIKVASVGLNAKDFYVLAGRVDTPDATCQLECAGSVVDVGSDVTEFTAGDRVVAMAPTHFQTYQTLPKWACHKLLEGESFDICATLPLVYATTIYALHHRAKIQSGETVLIHSGAGGVGIAAIQLAKLAGATVYTTVSTEEKKQYLIDTYGIEPSNIFSSRDTSFLAGVLKATSGRGVDVIINSLTGDQLHATWRCSAPFGRFVEIGKLDLSSAGRLEMDQFLKNTTFTSFDLSAIYAAAAGAGQNSSTANANTFRGLWEQLLGQVMSLYREGKITGFEPLQVFDVSEAAQAFRRFSSRSRMGKVAINLERLTSAIDVQPLRHTTRFSPEKSYVMIGCLGGLGRTLARWMVQRGARKFAFLGRSGTDKLAARNLVEDLESQGAECVVVRGDVCNPKDVESVVEQGAAIGKIGGVVQAAMGLNESIFSGMSNEHWHTGIDPKVQGTWHLYNALRNQGHDMSLDFFLMTSSVSGSVGTATESNYCAANHFLDAFARHLRARPERPIRGAVALGLGMISEVGYLHDNPEIEALLLRKGIQAIDADELLQIVDLALSSSSREQNPEHEMGIHHAYDRFAASHLLTGMEAFGLKELRKQGFEGTNLAWDDPRAGILANALDGSTNAGQVSGHGHSILPAEVVQRMENSEQPKSLADALLDHVRARFGNLVLMKFDAVDVHKPVSGYGMDSMIAAEFKTWFYQNMAVDIPLLTLLDKTSNLETLSGLALTELVRRLGEEESKS